MTAKIFRIRFWLALIYAAVLLGIAIPFYRGGFCAENGRFGFWIAIAKVVFAITALDSIASAICGGIRISQGAQEKALWPPALTSAIIIGFLVHSLPDIFEGDSRFLGVNTANLGMGCLFEEGWGFFVYLLGGPIVGCATFLREILAQQIQRRLVVSKEITAIDLEHL